MLFGKRITLTRVPQRMHKMLFGICQSICPLVLYRNPSGLKMPSNIGGCRQCRSYYTCPVYYIKNKTNLPINIGAGTLPESNWFKLANQYQGPRHRWTHSRITCVDNYVDNFICLYKRIFIIFVSYSLIKKQFL